MGYTGGEDGLNSTFQVKVGFRIDPGKEGGVFGLGSVGAGLAVGDGISGITSVGGGVGLRLREFLDVQVTREDIGDGRDPTYSLTLKVIAPKRVLKLHQR